MSKIMKRNQFIAFVATSMMALAFSMSANAQDAFGNTQVFGNQKVFGDKDKAAEIIRYSGK